jgi:cyclic pyranopterin phosphate synthase
MPLIDSFNRVIDYLRISVTDRCNFRCVYCMPEEGAPVAPKDLILTYEEIERLARIAVELGMAKLRITGGEPLVRKDIDILIEKIGRLPGLRDLSMTTNGFLLSRYAADFAQAGLNRVNISLDTLQPDRFRRIARRGNLQDVMAGIDAALSAGLRPLKVNCVVMRGWNDDEVVDFARMTQTMPIDVRFIELMPINWSAGDDAGINIPSGMNDLFALAAPAGYRAKTNVTLYANADLGSFHRTFKTHVDHEPTGQLDASQMRKAFIPTHEIRSRIEDEIGPLKPIDIITNGPARSFRLPGAAGSIGFISQITNDMCQTCNRLRLTADGQLRPCLMADGEVDLRGPLRAGATDAEIADLIRLTVFHKPKEHRLEDGMAPVGRNMSQLGG